MTHSSKCHAKGPLITKPNNDKNWRILNSKTIFSEINYRGRVQEIGSLDIILIGPKDSIFKLFSIGNPGVFSETLKNGIQVA